MSSENVFNFNSIPKRKSVAPQIEIATDFSKWDDFCVWLGVKNMAAASTTTPLEWNSKVLGLIGACFALAMAVGGMIWYSASLAAKVDYLQLEQQRTMQKIERMEEHQRQADLRREAARGFEMGVAESAAAKNKNNGK